MAEDALVPSGSSIAGKAVRVAFDGGRLTCDAGLLVLADIERRLGIAERLARCIEDPWAPERVHHTILEMIRFRVLLIAAGYPDANDCNALRADPAFKVALGRAPESGPDLCSQPTMCRLENLPGTTALKRMMAAMVELFCDSFEQVPNRIVLDIDDTCIGARQPTARTLPRPLRRALLPTDPRLRGHDGQASGGDPRPGKTPDGPEVTPVLRHVIRRIRAPLEWGSTDLTLGAETTLVATSWRHAAHPPAPTVPFLDRKWLKLNGAGERT